jgi:hypothetical protein
VKIKQLGEISWKNFLGGGGNFRFFGKFCTSAQVSKKLPYTPLTIIEERIENFVTKYLLIFASF